MTKMKSKKMTKSTFAIIIMGIVMVAMLAFGGTFAYFTAKAEDAGTATMKTGVVTLTAGTKINVTDTTKIMPGDANTQSGTFVSTATRGAYVGFKLEVTNTDSIPDTYLQVTVEGSGADKWVKVGDYWCYSTDGAKMAVAGSDGAETTLSYSIKVTLSWETPDDYQDTTLSYTLKGYSVQAANVAENGATTDAQIVALFK